MIRSYLKLEILCLKKKSPYSFLGLLFLLVFRSCRSNIHCSNRFLNLLRNCLLSMNELWCTGLLAVVVSFIGILLLCMSNNLSVKLNCRWHYTSSYNSYPCEKAFERYWKTALITIRYKGKQLCQSIRIFHLKLLPTFTACTGVKYLRCSISSPCLFPGVCFRFEKRGWTYCTVLADQLNFYGYIANDGGLSILFNIVQDSNN